MRFLLSFLPFAQMRKRPQTASSRFNKILTLLSVIMFVKSELWDRLSPSQRKRLVNSVQGAVARTTNEGRHRVRVILSKFTKN